MYLLQSIFLTSSYISSALLALKCAIGFSTLMAVCSWKLARYIVSLFPVNDTIRRPICTLLAPSWVSSCAKTSSNPIKVLAMSSNSSINLFVKTYICLLYLLIVDWQTRCYFLFMILLFLLFQNILTVIILLFLLFYGGRKVVTTLQR